MENQEENGYKEMKRKAGEFCKLLVEWEIGFKSSIDSYGEHLANYIEIKGKDLEDKEQIITVIFHESGGVTFVAGQITD